MSLTIGNLIRAMFPTGTGYDISEFDQSDNIPINWRIGALPREKYELLDGNAEDQTKQLIDFWQFQNDQSKETEQPFSDSNYDYERAKLKRRILRNLRFRKAPVLPTDIFAFTGMLLDLSGASHHAYAPTVPQDARVKRLARPLLFGPEQRAKALRVANEWRVLWPALESSPKYGKVRARPAWLKLNVPSAVQEAWSELLDHWETRVFLNLPQQRTDPEEHVRVPRWWSTALWLFVCCDETCRNVGFPGKDPMRTEVYRSGGGVSFSSLEYYFDRLLTIGRRPALSGNEMVTGLDGDYSSKDGLSTISTVPPDIACVLPKSRTAQVGCTLRSLSHNLALLPARGRARARWFKLLTPKDWVNAEPLPKKDSPSSKLRTEAAPQQVSEDAGDVDTSANKNSNMAQSDKRSFDIRKIGEPLNMLLIPLPYAIPNGSFTPSQFSNDESHQSYGWFDVGNDWSPLTKSTEAGIDGRPTETRETIYGLVEELARKAKSSAGPVNAIVFPEMSLDFASFHHLIQRIRSHRNDFDLFGGIDFVVAGLRQNEFGRPGNFAGACIFSKPNGHATRQMVWSTQEKHHRWRLDESQIKTYGLSPHLSPGLLWWEDIELLSRSLNVFVFRDASTLAPLICEDLARLEPIHELVRSIGPNLVIALLMDGAQIERRWPGRYALGLSEDPGSSILTFTSFGLLGRALQRETDPARKSFSIGLFRSDIDYTRELNLDDGASAIVLTLAGQNCEEVTIDGRADSATSMRWRYAQHISITADPQKFPWARAMVSQHE